jgi:hypothetical protein
MEMIIKNGLNIENLKIVVLDQKVVDLNLVEMVEVRQQSVI